MWPHACCRTYFLGHGGSAAILSLLLSLVPQHCFFEASSSFFPGSSLAGPRLSQPEPRLYLRQNSPTCAAYSVTVPRATRHPPRCGILPFAEKCSLSAQILTQAKRRAVMEVSSTCLQIGERG